LNIGAVFPVSGGSSGNIQNSDRSSGLRWIFTPGAKLLYRLYRTQSASLPKASPIFYHNWVPRWMPINCPEPVY
jgi:hypothetical protein